MGKIHVECLPDETLVKKLGITRKNVIHHTGKSRVFHNLKTSRNEIAMVDEDPGSPKTEYERGLKFNEESFGIKLYTDQNGNKVLVLKVKLEDWIISVCNNSGIDISKFGLPKIPNHLHDIINYRLLNFERLIDHLLKSKNESIVKLKAWLK